MRTHKNYLLFVLQTHLDAGGTINDLLEVVSEIIYDNIGDYGNADADAFAYKCSRALSDLIAQP